MKTEDSSSFSHPLCKAPVSFTKFCTLAITNLNLTCLSPASASMFMKYSLKFSICPSSLQCPKHGFSGLVSNFREEKIHRNRMP